MLGNFVTGCSVLAPAGMLSELASGLDVTIRTAGLLITFGAVVLCVGSPLTAWLTSRIERRRLLTITLAVMAFANIASAFAFQLVITPRASIVITASSAEASTASRTALVGGERWRPCRLRGGTSQLYGAVYAADTITVARSPRVGKA